MTKRNFLIVFIILFIIGIIFHLPMLRLGLTGDHLLAINEWRVRFIVPSAASFRAFINPYGASAILDKIIDWIWGFQAFPYFFISLITKILAATSAYFLAQHLFKSKIISSIVCLSALLLFNGTEANTPGSTIYISLFLLTLGFLRLLQSYDEVVHKQKIRDSLFVVSCFIISFAFTPARMYGLIPMILMADIYALIRKKTSTKLLLLRCCLFLGAVVFFKKIGLIDSYGTASGVASAVTSFSFYKNTPNLPGVLFFMLGSYRQVFIPDVVGQVIGQLGAVLHITQSLSYLLGLLPGLILFSLCRLNKKIPSWWAIVILVSHCIVLLGIMRFLSQEIIYTQLDVYLGGFVANLLVILLLAFIYGKDSLSVSAFAFFGTPLIFMIVPYLLYRLTPQETLSRYFAPSSYMGALILGYAIYFIRRVNVRIGTVFIAIVMVTLLYNAVLIHNYYAASGEAGAYDSYLYSTFNVMNNELGLRHGKEKPIVFVRSDDFTFMSVYLNQGSLRFSLVNDTFSDNAQPLFITDLNLLQEIYKGTAPHPYPMTKDINAFYGFEIKNKKTFSITEEIREYLRKSNR